MDLNYLKVDEGASNNNFLMQFQSDILGCEVKRPKVTETTALGACHLAKLARILKDIDDSKIKLNLVPHLLQTWKKI